MIDYCLRTMQLLYVFKYVVGLKCINLHTVIMCDVFAYYGFMCLGSQKEMALKVKQIPV